MNNTSSNSNNNNNRNNEEQRDIFDKIDNVVLTLFNEPSLGLYYTQEHIKTTFPKLMTHMDGLYDNRKLLRNTLLDMEHTIKDLKEITSLNDNYAYTMLAKINSLTYEVMAKKN